MNKTIRVKLHCSGDCSNYSEHSGCTDENDSKKAMQNSPEYGMLSVVEQLNTCG